MQSSSLPVGNVQPIVDKTLQSIRNPGHASFQANPSLVYSTSSSWATTNGFSSLSGAMAPVAWSGVRHQIIEEEPPKTASAKLEDPSASHCSQVVLLTCLHLSHEMALRDVGLYAWTLPHVKDPQGSTMKIMRHYSQQLRDLSLNTSLNVRAGPDPSRTSIQHHLQKARLAAGLEGYIAVVYSGHGIQEPPTDAGELWCYDKSFEECTHDGSGPSEYIPILLFDMLTWAGASTCYVWDCQHAGRFIRAALTEAEEIDTQLRAAAVQNLSVAAIHPAVYSRKQIHFAACGAHETLPRVTGMPDDLFTACLITPLRIALLHHNLQTFPLTTRDSTRQVQRSNGYMTALLNYMSQDLKDRLWGELQAILHTIAWQSLDGPTYQMLFGSSGDVVSAFASGFLLAQRVMGAYRANPESIPAIPSSTSHSLWTTWDLILDNLFEQLPPYFEEEGDQTRWEKDLKLVSFMEDQLASMLDSDGPLFAADVGTTSRTGLSRLPIICQAAMTPEFHHRACRALDHCLRDLDMRGLTHAIQGRALSIAAQLLSLDDDQLAPQMVSIWSSLVRHEQCVASLAAAGRTAERLTSVPSVRFFLDALEKNLKLEDDMPVQRRAICQTAAVLSTIANYVSGREAPRFVKRTLQLGAEMLAHEQDLVRQWGALMIAEVMGSIRYAEEDLGGTMATLKKRLLEMTDSANVETRGTAIHALAQWVSTETALEILDLRSAMELVQTILPKALMEGSDIVRREIIKLFHRALSSGGRWTVFALWIYILGTADGTLFDSVKEPVKQIGLSLNMGDERKIFLRTLTNMISILDTMRNDPNKSVAGLVNKCMQKILEGLQAYMTSTTYDSAVRIAFPLRSNFPSTIEWTEPLLQEVIQAGRYMAKEWPHLNISYTLIRHENELFDRSKVSLQAYLAEKEMPLSSPECLDNEKNGGRDRGYQMRYRSLEDSLLVAEQQIGLTWQWEMKNISSPDPWSSVTFHSFLSTVMSCNNTSSILMWDWTSSRKTGSVTLDLSPGNVITSARFVNELYSSVVVLAETSRGDVHVLSAPSGSPTELKPISSFLALDMRRSLPSVRFRDRKLVTTWWRQSGKLCAGGPTSVINMWDCPAERCSQILDTDSDTRLTSLITEPVSGNIIIGGFADGMVKLWDTRTTRRQPLLAWDSSSSNLEERTALDRADVESIVKLGVTLGESKHITSACANGLLRIYDLRRANSPTSSLVAHADGIASASFQAHSGLMSTVGKIASRDSVSSSANVSWAIHRSTLGRLTTVSTETFKLGNPFASANFNQSISKNAFVPYTTIHNLRPFLGVGFGTECVLRGSGKGKGDDTDSGSYSFLHKQARQV